MSPNGDDSGPGTSSNPFGSIYRCTKTPAPRTCIVTAGVYAENTINLPSNTTITGRGNPTISGLSPVNSTWVRAGSSGGCIWKTTGTVPMFQQLFYGEDMMVEARWPNIDVKKIPDVLFERSSWRTVGAGSSYGTIIDPGLDVPFSWNGALATLQVAHQFYTWTRNVTGHFGSSIHYPQNLPSLAGASDPNSTFWGNKCTAKCNAYFLSGKIEALDSPGEWWRAENGTVFFMPPEGCAAPLPDAVRYKRQDYAFVSSNTVGVTVQGVRLVGNTINLSKCTTCRVHNVEVRWPTYDREIRELNVPKGSVASTYVEGSNISIYNTSLVSSTGF